MIRFLHRQSEIEKSYVSYKEKGWMDGVPQHGRDLSAGKNRREFFPVAISNAKTDAQLPGLPPTETKIEVSLTNAALTYVSGVTLHRKANHITFKYEAPHPAHRLRQNNS
jgi:hypothetical protein